MNRSETVCKVKLKTWLLTIKWVTLWASWSVSCHYKVKPGPCNAAWLSLLNGFYVPVITSLVNHQSEWNLRVSRINTSILWINIDRYCDLVTLIFHCQCMKTSTVCLYKCWEFIGAGIWKKQLWLFRKWCHCKKWSYTKISQDLFVNSLFFYPQLINISSPFICCFKNETLLTQSCISCPSDGLATASSQWMLAFPWRQILLRVL